MAWLAQVGWISTAWVAPKAMSPPSLPNSCFEAQQNPQRWHGWRRVVGVPSSLASAKGNVPAERFSSLPQRNPQRWHGLMAWLAQVRWISKQPAKRQRQSPDQETSQAGQTAVSKPNEMRRDGMAGAGWVDFRAAWVAPKTMSPNDAAMLTVIACVTVQKIIRPSAFLQSSECVSDEMVSNR